MNTAGEWHNLELMLQVSAVSSNYSAGHALGSSWSLHLFQDNAICFQNLRLEYIYRYWTQGSCWYFPITPTFSDYHLEPLLPVGTWWKQYTIVEFLERFHNLGSKLHKEIAYMLRSGKVCPCFPAIELEETCRQGTCCRKANMHPQ